MASSRSKLAWRTRAERGVEAVQPGRLTLVASAVDEELLVFLRAFVVAARAVLGVHSLVLVAVGEGVVDEVLEPRAGVAIRGLLELRSRGGVVAELLLVPEALKTQGDEAHLVRAQGE